MDIISVTDEESSSGFPTRILAEEASKKEKADMIAYERQLSEKEREAAYTIARAVRQGIADVRQATANNTLVGKRAEDFLAEMEQG
ncbi:MAG: hypothetical protein J6O49_04855 [Bacteroidaceae bacterium]|nr:hypothetical protein [Bacteroidaceae bacterium]